MPPAFIRMKVRGIRRAKLGIRRAQREARELDRFTREVVPIVFDSYDRNFQRNGAEHGSAWRQLTEATIRRKEVAGISQPARINVRSGKLKDALTSRGRGTNVQVDASRVKIANTVEAEGGGSLVVAVRTDRRPVEGAEGIGPRGLRELDQAWERHARRIEKAVS